MDDDEQISIHARVATALQATACPYRVHAHARFAQPITNPADFAAGLGIRIERITKTLFVSEQKSSGRTALFCCPIPARVDLQIVAKAFGFTHLQMATEARLNELLSYPRNGVSPLGAPADVVVLLDEALFAFPTVFIGSGIAAIEIELTPNDLLRTSGGKVFTHAEHKDG